jgi:uncharacterized flavoprotein (TIGR03862 family)
MKKSIAIFGGGPAALMMASFLDPERFNVTIYEQNKTCGRKFLVAGKGGFNLTHSEPLESLIKRYIPQTFLGDALNHFTNEDLRTWLNKLGIETFIGSSKRVFPVKGIKPIVVLDAIIGNLKERGVNFQYQKKWSGWSAKGKPTLEDGEVVNADFVVFGFGGGSWKVTGSTGSWAKQFESKGISLNEFEPSNCAFKVDWSKELLEKIEGKPIKNIAVSCGNMSQKGELVATNFGLEGNAIYALSHNIRESLNQNGSADISIDFKPMLSLLDLQNKVEQSKTKKNTDLLKNDLNLSNVQVALIKNQTSKEEFLDRQLLIEKIKNASLTIVGTAPIDEAISTVGGVKREELTDHFELNKMIGTFCIGEMVDWDAPTGGYLLQGCFSMGAYLANFLNHSE